MPLLAFFRPSLEPMRLKRNMAFLQSMPLAFTSHLTLYRHGHRRNDALFSKGKKRNFTKRLLFL